MNDFSVTPFLKMVYEDVVKDVREPMDAIVDWDAYAKTQKDKIRNFLKLPRLEQKYKIPLMYRKIEERKVDGIHIQKYRLDAIRNLSVAVHVLFDARCKNAGTDEIPVDLSKRKAILYLNGHGQTGARGAYTTDKHGEKTLGMELVRMGYLVLVPELFAFGEAKRDDAKPDIGACESCTQIEPALLNFGLNLVGLRVWEAMKTLDFAEAAFGMHHFSAYGISGGGHVCNYTGVLDDRIETVVLSGYPNLYKYSTLAMQHCICNYVPGQMEVGESHYVTALAAPRKKLLVMNGKDDPIFLIQGSRIAFDYLKKVYEKLGAGKNFTSILFNGGHMIAIPEVCAWLKEHDL